MRGMRAHASMTPGQPGGNPHADQGASRRGTSSVAARSGVTQQTQQAHMNYVQIGAYGGGPGPGNGGNDMSNSGRGGAQMGGMMMQQQQQQGQQGNAYQNSGNGGGAYSQPMMRVPSSGSLGMMPPGTPGYGYGGEQGQARRGFEASGKGAKRAAGKNAGGRVPARSGARRGRVPR